MKLVNQDSVLSWVNRVVTEDDHTAFAQLVEKHQSMIRQFLRRLTAGNHSLADDLSQDTFLLAYQKMSQFKATGSFSAWLHTIAYREFLKSIQSITTLPLESHEWVADKSGYPMASSDGMKAVDADIYAEQLMALLRPKERVVVTLSCAAGMSHGEIQAVTNMPLGTIKSMLLRSKQKIIKHCGQQQAMKEVQS